MHHCSFQYLVSRVTRRRQTEQNSHRINPILLIQIIIKYRLLIDIRIIDPLRIALKVPAIIPKRIPAIRPLMLMLQAYHVAELMPKTEKGRRG